MGRGYRIRVIGKPRQRPDPAMLAQVVILLGRHLHAQQQQAAAQAEQRSDQPGKQ